jgi:uncharacterized protein YbjT (DUF2867 family)
MRIVIAGASGFVGQALCKSLSQNHHVTAVSRRQIHSISDQPSKTGLFYKKADLFSLRELEIAMSQAEVGIYLVHSMLPPNRLSQGSFSDFDTILADNFARAAESCRLRRIVYLGGLIPDEELSPHLASRLEVEWILAGRNVPVITLRAGLIVGDEGSSFTILDKLVRRLPMMICPSWTTQKSQPIYIDDVVRIFNHVIPDEDLPAGSYDIGGPDQLSYLEMMRAHAKHLNLRRFFIPVRFMSPRLSRLWVRLVTRSPRQLVYPLIESLKHKMIVRNQSLMDRYQLKTIGFHESLELIEQIRASKSSPEAHRSNQISVKNTGVSKRPSAATSIQRLPLPLDMNMKMLGREYARWIHQLLRPILAVDVEIDGSMSFYFRPIGRWMRGIKLLDLVYSNDRSDSTRQLFYISGGWLLSRQTTPIRGRLEFRRLPNSDEAIAAVLDFVPRLPWWIYRYTQAIVHALIMHLFGIHLKKLSNRTTAETT